MKRVQHVLSMTLLLVLASGWSSLAEAGCGGKSSCEMSHEKVQQTTAAQANPVQYTCPMHPEVVSDKPGECPKCGMTLQKTAVKDAEESNGMGEMAAQCQLLVDEFTALLDHFNSMMKLTEVDDLAPEMIKHGEMMALYSDRLENHLKMCRQMTSSTKNQVPNDTETSNHAH